MSLILAFGEAGTYREARSPNSWSSRQLSAPGSASMPVPSPEEEEKTKSRCRSKFTAAVDGDGEDGEGDGQTWGMLPMGRVPN